MTLLIYALCLPCITLAYLLRGIDLPAKFAVLRMNLLTIGWCVLLAIFIACLSLPFDR